LLSFLDDSGHRARDWSRREWLRIGGLAGLGWAQACHQSRLHAETSSLDVPGFGRAKSVIVVFAGGGQSQLDTWDPKPDAPLEIRGAFDAIASAVPGSSLCEHMPRLAQAADKYTIVRSMSHEDLDHGSALYLSLTGRYHARRSSNPRPQPTDLPAYSSIYKRLQPATDSVDAALHVNGPAIISPNTIGPGQFGGLLGREYDPSVVGDVTQGPVVVPGLVPQPQVPTVRLQHRRKLLESIDHTLDAWAGRRAADNLGIQYDRAFAMLADPRTRAAFDLGAEPDAIRNSYGRDRSGQACLLARRLVEAGVPLITVFWNHHSRGQDDHPELTEAYGWDTHNDIFDSLQNHLLPRFDQSFATLLEDLDGRGLLDETLVICMGEFGRAPLVALEPNFAGSTPGRKHWAAVYSIVAAGAGVGRGKVLGRSDRVGAYPAAPTYGPWDVVATIFSALGIDPANHFHDAIGRPYPVSIGKPITGLYSG